MSASIDEGQSTVPVNRKGTGELLQPFAEKPSDNIAEQWEVVNELAALRFARRFAEAETLLEKSLEKFPGSVLILNERGMLNQAQGKLSESLQDFTKVLEIDPENEFAAEWKLMVLRSMNDSTEIEKFLALLSQQFPLSSWLPKQKGLIHYEQKDYEAAIECFDEALAVDETNEQAAEWKLNALRALRSFPEAHKYLTEVFERFPLRSWVPYQQGLLLYDEKNYEKAIESFDQAFSLDQTNELAAEWKLNALRASRSFPEAHKYLAEVFGRFPLRSWVPYQQGLLLYDEKDYEKAIESFDQAFSLDQTNELAAEWKLISLRMAKKLDEASEYLEQIAQQFAGRPWIAKQEGLLRYDQMNYEAAIESFERALVLDPANDVAAEWKVAALRNSHQLEEAEKFLGEISPRFPDRSWVPTQYGFLHHERKDYSEAVKSFNRAIELDPANELATEWKLIALRFAKQFPDADAFLAEILTRFPQRPWAIRQQGLLSFDEGKYADAAQLFKQAGEMNGDDEFDVRWRITSLRNAARIALTPNYREIEKELKQALTLFAASVELALEEGWLWYDRREYDRSTLVFDKVLLRNPSTEDAFVGKIESLRADRRTEEAGVVIKDALKVLPDSTQIRREQAALFFDEYRYARALAVFNELLAKDARDVFAAKLKIASLRSLGQDGEPDKFDEAEKYWEQVIGQIPNNTDLLIERAQLSLACEQREDADDYFVRALDLDPSGVAVTSAYAAFLTSTNRPDRALEVLLKLKEKYDGNADVVDQLGWFYLSRSDYSKAQKEFEAVADSAPLVADNGVGAVHFNRREYSEAESYFRRTLEKSPNHPVFKTNLAWALVRSGDEKKFSEAQELCKKALALNSTYSPALGCLGVLSFKQGQLAQAEEYLRESTRINRREGNYTELGALYVQMGKYDDAETALRQALKNNGNDVQALIELGNLYLQTDRDGDAIKQFRTAVAIAPTNEDCHRALAIALMKLDNLDEAERVIRTVIKKLDQNKRWLLHLTLSQVLTKRGDKVQDTQFYEEALSEVKKTITLRSDRPEVFLHCGTIRYKLGDLIRSRQDFRHCLKLAPDNYEAERNMRLVERRFLKESPLVKTTLFGGILLAIICLVQLWIVWRHFLSGIVSDKVLMMMVPLLLGLFVVALLLPVLVRLKLPGGFEAELTQPKSTEMISSGPKGDVNFSSSSPMVSSGPS